MAFPLPLAMENLVKAFAEHPLTEDMFEEHKRSPLSFTCPFGFEKYSIPGPVSASTFFPSLFSIVTERVNRPNHGAQNPIF